MSVIRLSEAFLRQKIHAIYPIITLQNNNFSDII